MANPDVPGDYEVGFKKPPLASRFQKGQSGNPSGKRKRPLRPDELLEKELAHLDEAASEEEVKKRLKGLGYLS